MKKILYKIIKNLPLPIVRKIRSFSRKKYYAIDNIDVKLQKHLNYNNGFFIEVGANDGINQSNTFYLEKKRNWTGVLIEPAPNNYISCKNNRSTLNNYYCNACVSFNYKEEYVKMAYSNLVSTSFNLDSDISNPVLQAQKGMPSYKDNEIPLFGAIACTMNDILKASNAPQNIDFFSLDVEGAELEVLKGIDFNEYYFKYILVECRDINRLETFLNETGYRLIDKLSQHDYLFKLS